MSAVAVNSTLARGVDFLQQHRRQKSGDGGYRHHPVRFLLGSHGRKSSVLSRTRSLERLRGKSAARAGASLDRAHRSARRRDPAHRIIHQPGANQEQRAAGGYVRKQSVGSTYASRTMYWSGPIVLAFFDLSPAAHDVRHGSPEFPAPARV